MTLGERMKASIFWGAFVGEVCLLVGLLDLLGGPLRILGVEISKKQKRVILKKCVFAGQNLVPRWQNRIETDSII